MTLSLASDRRAPAGRTADGRGAALFGSAVAKTLATGRRTVSTSHRARGRRVAAAVVREAERLALVGAGAPEGVEALMRVSEGDGDALAQALAACSDAVARYPGSVAARRSVQLLHAAIEALGLDLDIAG